MHGAEYLGRCILSITNASSIEYNSSVDYSIARNNEFGEK